MSLIIIHKSQKYWVVFCHTVKISQHEEALCYLLNLAEEVCLMSMQLELGSPNEIKECLLSMLCALSLFFYIQESLNKTHRKNRDIISPRRLFPCQDGSRCSPGLPDWC